MWNSAREPIALCPVLRGSRSGAGRPVPGPGPGTGGVGGLVEDSAQGGPGGGVELVDAAVDGAEHVPFGAGSAADGLFVVDVGVHRLDHTPGGAAPGADPG